MKRGQPESFTRPIPKFAKVTEVIHFAENFVALIAPDLAAGKRGRYTVVQIDRLGGRTRVVGCEVSLRLARQVAVTPWVYGESFQTSWNKLRV